MVDYSKYRDINYYPRAAPPEYGPTFLDDEFHKISHAIDQYAQNYYPSKNASAKTGDYTATILDDVLLCSGSTTITLYDAAGQTDNNGIQSNAGRRITIKNIGTSSITIAPVNSQTIDGSTTKIITVQYVALELFSDGTAWHII